MKNNFRQKLLLASIFVFLLSINSPLFSQEQVLKTIRGTLSDAEGALSGVNVIVKNTSRGVISDMEGKYSIAVKSTDSVVFSYIGYKTQTLGVGNRSVLNVTMMPDATALDQVVINAGYYKVLDAERTGSISSIDAEEIENRPVSNPLAAMQGRVAGVHITPQTGLAGGGYEVQIRGQNSIAAGNDPLYIIDGIPYDSRSMGFANVGATTIPGGRISVLSLINTSDIESIEILKDADATAIYGSRGANGVILITTKKGVAGRTAVTLNTYTGVARVARTMDYMKTDQYLAMRRAGYLNDGFTELPVDAYDINGTWDPNRYTDWQKELIGGTAYINDLQGSVSGGSKRTSFLLSGNYHKETTVYPKDFKYEKISVLGNLSHRSDDERFQVNFSSNYASEANDLPGVDLSQFIRFLPPNAPALYDADGNINFENSTFANPLAELEGKYLTNRRNLIANTRLSYQLFSRLKLLANAGYTTTILEESRTNPHTKYDPAIGLTSSSSSIYTNDAKRESWIFEPQLNYEYLLKNSSIAVLLGASYQKQTDKILSHYARGFASNSVIYNLAAANSLLVQRDRKEAYKYQAYFGRINYKLFERYIFNLTGRRDGSSRFGPGNRYANFWAIGGAWLFGEETGVKNALPFLSFGKLRVGYGVTGNDQIGDYQYLETYSTTGSIYDGLSGLEPSRIYNADFGWETNRKLSAALELGFIRNRINFTFEYYRNRSSNQLVGNPLPGTTGFSNVQSNLDAVVENSGIEVTLHTENFRGENFRWETAINLSIPKNRLVAFPNLEGSTYANQYVIGEPLGIKKLYHLIGVNPETGIYEFEDYNGDGKISAPDDRQYTVSVMPEVYGGISNSLFYKNWELNFLFQFTKRQGYNYVLGSAAPGQMGNQPAFLSGEWQQPGDEAEMQQFTAGYNPEALIAFSQYMFSNASITDASFVRLRDASLSYTLPKKGTTGTACKIYLQGQNLLVFTKFKGGDPEQLTGFLPPLRKVTMGIQLSI